MVALGIRGAAVAANPDIAFVIDGDSVIRIRPIVTRARSAPMPDEVALLVELQNRRSRKAPLRGGWLRVGVNFHGFERSSAMNDPNVVLGVHRNTHGRTDDPMVRKGFRPQGANFKLRRLDTDGFAGTALFAEHGTSPYRRAEPKPAAR